MQNAVAFVMTTSNSNTYTFSMRLRFKESLILLRPINRCLTFKIHHASQYYSKILMVICVRKKKRREFDINSVTVATYYRRLIKLIFKKFATFYENLN